MANNKIISGLNDYSYRNTSYKIKDERYYGNGIVDTYSFENSYYQDYCSESPTFRYMPISKTFNGMNITIQHLTHLYYCFYARDNGNFNSQTSSCRIAMTPSIFIHFTFEGIGVLEDGFGIIPNPIFHRTMGGYNDNILREMFLSYFGNHSLSEDYNSAKYENIDDVEPFVDLLMGASNSTEYEFRYHSQYVKTMPYVLGDVNYTNVSEKYTYNQQRLKFIEAFDDFWNNYYINNCSDILKQQMTYCLANYINIPMPGNTKTYTNSTWDTKKTWYIKTTFSKNTQSNVVNYEPMLRDKYLLIKIII